MPDRVPLVLKVFKVELEETENDVTQLLEYYFQKLESDEITPYVWKENRALLNRELDCLKELEKDLNDWSPSSPDTSGMEALGEIKDFLPDGKLFFRQ